MAVACVTSIDDISGNKGSDMPVSKPYPVSILLKACNCCGVTMNVGVGEVRAVVDTEVDSEVAVEVDVELDTAVFGKVFTDELAPSAKSVPLFSGSDTAGCIASMAMSMSGRGAIDACMSWASAQK